MSNDLIISDVLPDVKLSTIRPDYADLRDQMNSVLSVSPVWRDIIPAATGEILIKFVAGVGAYGQYTIERGVQECFLDTAKSPQNILTLARLLGVRIKRKTPARVNVRLSRQEVTSSYTIEQYSEFNIQSTRFYNPETIVFLSGEDHVDVELVEGRVVTHDYISNGSAFQTYYIGSGFTTSNELVRVTVDGVEWERLEGGIWMADNPVMSTGQYFSDLTTQGGSAQITFGNDTVGAIPTLGSAIRILEYVVRGPASNVADSGLSVAYLSDSAISGTTTGPIYGAEDEPSSEFYKAVGAKTGRSDSRFVSRSDYNSNLVFYPGVIDCRAVGEWEEGTQLELMNKINLYLLTTDEFQSETDPQQFLDYVYERGMLATRHEVFYAESIVANIAGQLLIDPRYSVSDVLNRVYNALIAFFAPKYGSLKRPVYRHDIGKVVQSVTGVRHLVLNEPTVDYLPTFRQWVRLGTMSFSTVYAEN